MNSDSGCKDIGIRTFESVAKTQFLTWDRHLVCYNLFVQYLVTRGRPSYKLED